MSGEVRSVQGQEAIDLSREFTVKFVWYADPSSEVYSIDEVDSFGTPMIQINFVDTSLGNEGRLWFEWDRHIGLEVVE